MSDERQAEREAFLDRYADAIEIRLGHIADGLQELIAEVRSLNSAVRAVLEAIKWAK